MGGTKGGTRSFKFGVGKKRESQENFHNLRWESNVYRLCIAKTPLPKESLTFPKLTNRDGVSNISVERG